MSFLEYVKDNKEGLSLITKMRYTIQSICYNQIKMKCDDITKKDIDKLILMLEFNFFDSFTDESELDINTITFQEVKIMIGSFVDIHNLLGGIEKNKRGSYKDILWNVLGHAFGLIDIEKACQHSGLINKYFTIECGIYESETSESEMDDCLTEIYKYLLKDKIEL